MFDPVDPKQSLPDMEEGILQYWKEEDTFKRSLKQRKRTALDILDHGKKTEGSKQKADSFSFYDGPPFATGLPHYGHLLAGTIKDVIPRYQTMRGKYVERRFGWDCHGLPIENLIEQEHDIKNKQEIEEKGVKWFNDLCRGSVQRYTSDWRTVVERMGRWVDMDWDYRTMDPEYMESMWWAFSSLQKKGLIYEGHKPMHICPRCVTPLSNFEVTQAYQDITDHSVTAKFELVDESGTFVLAWTTTPWTLPGNLLLAFHKDIDYATVSMNDEKYVLAKDLVESVFKDQEYDVTGTQKGSALVGKQYKPLFPYFADEYKNAFRIVEGDFVTTDEGTGVVHIAPGFGEDDFRTGQKEGLELLQHLTMEGKFIDAVTDFAGMDVKPKDDSSKTDKKIADWLEQHGKLFSRENYKHSYPHCWRCDSPLLNYATSSWFVRVEAIKDKMLANNAKTQWMPAFIRDGRFGNWLENARDWAISRSRYWGTPLPIWRSSSSSERHDGDMDVVSSRDELMKRCLIRFTKVTAIRHAESEGNLIPIYQGVEPGTDLTKRGKAQAKEVGKFLKNQKIAVVYCSPLARARQTAQTLAKQLGAEVVVDERLREVSFGEYEGKTVDFSDLAFVKARRAHKLDTGRPESIYHFDGMETWRDVSDRIENFMSEILPKHRSEHIVIVTHADPLQNIRKFFTGVDPLKLSHQPYPSFAAPYTFFWDHKRDAQMDLHMDNVDDIVWSGSESDKSVDVTLVRHGETEWNREYKMQGGAVDLPLNETGKEQAMALAKHLKGKHFDAIVSSDRKRARQTAEILSKELNIPLEESLPELSERILGEWSGMNRMQFIKEKGSNAGFYHETPKDGEGLSAFLDRVQKGIDIVHSKYSGKKILIVSHQATMQAIRTLVENRSYDETKTMIVKNTESVSIQMNSPMHRIPEVLDCWFESGSMPYAQVHYPFEMGDAKRKIPKDFPANFIAEGLDQTRAWFYTLMVLSTALFNETPFKNVVVNGIVLAEDGKKMSKRLRNYPDPIEVVDRHGADAVRFTLMSSPAVRAEDLRFSEKLVEETVRNVLLPLWNTYSFFVTYANAANFEAVETRRHSSHSLDQWMLAEVQDLVNRMTEELDRYDLSATCAELHETIDALTNWYVRLSRRRFANQDIDAMHTLHDVLLTLCQALAPFCPYITDAIYLNLVPEDNSSVHLTDWPEPRELKAEEKALLEKTRLMRLIVSLGNSIRAEKNVKNRQPLSKAIIAVSQKINCDIDDLALLRQELNVKSVEFAENPEELAEAYVQVNARKVGPRLGSRVQEIIKAGKECEFSIEKNGGIRILDEVLSPDEAQLVYRSPSTGSGQVEKGSIAADKGVVVSLDTSVTDELEQEGAARDLIRAVQRLRKESGLHFTDHINLHVSGLDDVVQQFGKLIAEETRAELKENEGAEHNVEVSGKQISIKFSKK